MDYVTMYDYVSESGVEKNGRLVDPQLLNENGDSDHDSPR